MPYTYPHTQKRCPMHKLPFFAALAFLFPMVLTQSCQDFSLRRGDAQIAIGFSANVVQGTFPATKASGEIGEEALRTGGFGVFACHTGIHTYGEVTVSPDFLYNERLSWGEGDGWTYSPLAYWPSDEEAGQHYLSFFAYAPYSSGDASLPYTNPAGYCIPSWSRPAEPSDPWLLYRLHPDANYQVDLLYAELVDQTRPGISARLPFTFRHALACVGDNVTIGCGAALMSQLKALVDGGSTSSIALSLTSVTVTYSLLEKGRLVLWSADPETPSWQAVLSENPLTVRTAFSWSGDETLYSYDGASSVVHSWRKSGRGIFAIPLNVDGVDQTATVTVTLKIVRGVEDPVTQTNSRTLFLRGSLEAGQSADITVSLSTLIL